MTSPTRIPDGAICQVTQTDPPDLRAWLGVGWHPTRYNNDAKEVVVDAILRIVVYKVAKCVPCFSCVMFPLDENWRTLGPGTNLNISEDTREAVARKVFDYMQDSLETAKREAPCNS